MGAKNPGDVDDSGAIIVGHNRTLKIGRVYVTTAQAEAAEKHGWELVDGPFPNGLCIIERTH